MGGLPVVFRGKTNFFLYSGSLVVAYISLLVSIMGDGVLMVRVLLSMSPVENHNSSRAALLAKVSLLTGAAVVDQFSWQRLFSQQV